MIYELYRLDVPTDVTYTACSTSIRLALVDCAINAKKAGDVFLYSQKTLTAVTSKGVLGIRRKAA